MASNGSFASMQTKTPPPGTLRGAAVGGDGPQPEGGGGGDNRRHGERVECNGGGWSTPYLLHRLDRLFWRVVASQRRDGAMALRTRRRTRAPTMAVRSAPCRELMAKFVKEHNGDSRFAVLPGVLHDNPVWGNGTTEYALDALLNAPHQQTKHNLPVGGAYVCPIDPDTRIPMIFVEDLMRGLVALQEADEASLNEPEQGYCVPGLSFTPNELFNEIRSIILGLATASS